MTMWQDIKYAHQDGTCYLLFDGRDMFTGQFEDGYVSGWTDHRGHDCNPTHFMSLPDEPK